MMQRPIVRQDKINDVLEDLLGITPPFEAPYVVPRLVVLTQPLLSNAQMEELIAAKKIRTARAEITAASRYMSLEQYGTGVYYTVPTGKQARITRVVATFSAASQELSIGYADDGVADGVAAPTNPVWLVGNAVRGALAQGAAAETTINQEIGGLVPAAKIPFAKLDATAGRVQLVVIFDEETAYS